MTNPFGYMPNFGNGFSFEDFISNAAAKGTSFAETVEDEGDENGENAYDALQKEFDAYRKRVEISHEKERKSLIKEMIGGFLDVVDFILYSYKAKNQMGTYTKEDEMVLNKLITFLSKYDVRPMNDQTGKPFDHNFHEAILVDHSGMFETDTVVMTLSQGYMIGDEVLRHAKVTVAGIENEPALKSVT